MLQECYYIHERYEIYEIYEIYGMQLDFGADNNEEVRDR